MSSKELKTCDGCGKSVETPVFTNASEWIAILVQRNAPGDAVDTKGDACSIACAQKILEGALTKLRTYVSPPTTPPKRGPSFEFDR